MGYFARYNLDPDCPRKPSSITNSAFYGRSSDEEPMFDFYEDGTATVTMDRYCMYPLEELPPGVESWSWRKVGRLLLRRVMARPRSLYYRHWPPVRRRIEKDNERFARRFVLGIFRDHFPDAYARYKEYNADEED